MSREDIVAIASRLFAVFLVVVALRGLGGVVRFASAPQATGTGITVVAVTALVPLLLAALLWFFPLTVARRLLPVMRSPGPTLDFGGSVLPVALTVLGFWVLSTAVTDLVYWGLLLALAASSSIPVEFPPDEKAAMVSTVAELGLAAWLLLGSHGLSAAVARLRQAGTTRTGSTGTP